MVYVRYGVELVDEPGGVARDPVVVQSLAVGHGVGSGEFYLGAFCKAVAYFIAQQLARCKGLFG